MAKSNEAEMYIVVVLFNKSVHHVRPLRISGRSFCFLVSRQSRSRRALRFSVESGRCWFCFVSREAAFVIRTIIVRHHGVCCCTVPTDTDTAADTHNLTAACMSNSRSVSGYSYTRTTPCRYHGCYQTRHDIDPHVSTFGSN